MFGRLRRRGKLECLCKKAEDVETYLVRAYVAVQMHHASICTFTMCTLHFSHCANVEKHKQLRNSLYDLRVTVPDEPATPSFPLTPCVYVRVRTSNNATKEPPNPPSAKRGKGQDAMHADSPGQQGTSVNPRERVLAPHRVHVQLQP